MSRVLLDFTGAPAPGVHLAIESPVRTVVADTTDQVRDALAAIDEAVAAGLTAAGFIAYEAAPAFEPRMRTREGRRLPLLWFGLFDETGVSGAASARVSRGASGAAPRAFPGTAAPATEWAVETDRLGHRHAVDRIREEIAAGRTYQVNLSTRFRGPFRGDPLELWDGMRRAQGPGFHAFLQTEQFTIASASPELFFATRGRTITTRPMKGTRPRGRWPAEDAALRAALAASPKDRAENLMIVDLLRNDLGRIAATGTVQVPRLLDIERFRTVWQMTSTVTATLREGVGLTGILDALFPCGSVTGAPKISTMEIIADLEPWPREVYCGAIGVVRPGGDATFSVPIRTAWIDHATGQAEYGAGGGVVWDSTPGEEYDELLAKAVVVRSPWPPFRLLETLRLEAGAFVRLDRHLARLRDSADHFGFPFPDDDVAAALDAIRRRHTGGRHRVRVLLGETGEVDVEAAEVEGPVGPVGPDGKEVPGRATGLAGERVALAAVGAVHSRDRFLYHKTTRRDAYDLALAAAPAGSWDVILVNERGELTELTRGNLVIERDGGLLEAEVIAEATLRPPDLERATGLWLINSLRGWVPLSFGP